MFVKYSRDGVVRSVMKVQVMPAHLDQPFADLAEGDSVLEVSGPLTDVGTMELHTGYQIDVTKKQMVKKATPTSPSVGGG